MTQRTWLLIGAAVVIVLAIFLFMGGEEAVETPAEEVIEEEAPAAD
jgi:hypothetical protein